MEQLPTINVNPETFFSEDFVLPALPKILTQIQEAMASEDVTVGQIAELISNDPALVIQILRIVNSAYYGLPKKIGEVKLAAAYLGIEEVYRIVLSVSIMNTLATDQEQEFNKIWLHSLFTSLCVKHIAQQYKPLLADGDLRAAAIVHDVGKLVYLKFFPDHFKALDQYTLEHGCLFSEAEETYALPSSAYIGMLLCDYWELPDTIKYACGYHSLKDLDPMADDRSPDPSTSVVAAGNMAAVLAMDGLSKEKRTEITDAIMTYLKIDEPTFLFLMADIYELKDEATNFLA